MKRVLLGVAIGLLVVLLAGYALRTRIVLRLMERTVAANMQTNLAAELPDGLHVALCGAGSPLPDPDRSGPCVAVIAGTDVYIVDSGSGSSRVMSRMRVPHGQVQAILLTHFHSDHIDGLGELLMQRWVNGTHRLPTPVHGPPGVEKVVEGINLAYQLDQGYRVAHHGEETVPPSGAGGVARPFATPGPGSSVPVLQGRDGLRVSAFRIDHSPISPAVGYRFDYKGRSVVISGDTVQSADLEKAAAGADLLVHEALAPNLVAVLTAGAERANRKNLAKITTDILDYHTSPADAAKSASRARVGHLLFYHIVPPLLLAPMVDLFLEGVDDEYDGPYTVGRDGTLVLLPAGSKSIEVEELL
jgi:ribonuclease Z